jgi:hypothetical protein
MNHKFADSGIPRDSAGSETALGRHRLKPRDLRRLPIHIAAGRRNAESFERAGNP